MNERLEHQPSLPTKTARLVKENFDTALLYVATVANGFSVTFNAVVGNEKFAIASGVILGLTTTIAIIDTLIHVAERQNGQVT